MNGREKHCICESSERGVALVITLIMLSIVTLMAVVFLAISRREKASVTVTADQADARLMADAAVARALSEITVRMITRTNAFDYDFTVSTNFAPDTIPTSNLSIQLQRLANLQYDPRPPVYIPTNEAGATEFRFFLDLNRNGRFEPSGVRPVLANDGSFYDTNGRPTTVFNRANVQMQYFVGDPEWIGVLERPERPHSESNRFVGRFAYLVLPAGKSLDFNFIHNNAKFISPEVQSDGYLRNHGFGSWELNLAAFFRDLNTNSWRDYLYRINPLSASTGDAFEDARIILAHRYFDYQRGSRRLQTVNDLFGPALGSIFRSDGIDGYSDGPLYLASSVNNLDRVLPGDVPTKPWSGSSNPQGYYDIQELFDPYLLSADFVRRLQRPMTNTASYDRYTFYRLLAQMGTDSKPADLTKVYHSDFSLRPTNKLHLNYRNEVRNGQTNFVPWDPFLAPGPQLPAPRAAELAARNPLDFFYEAADRLMRANLRRSDTTNALVRLPSGEIVENVALLSATRLSSPPIPFTHFVMGVKPVRPEFALTNIQLHYYGPTNGVPFYSTNNEYSADVHQLLQVAANLYDATTVRRLGTTNDYPSVFRPTFLKTGSNVVISGYVEAKNTLFLANQWRTVEEIAADPSLPISTNLFGINIFGVPAVIGAKKGYPNFNELSLESVVQVSRKLEMRKSGGAMQTNQLYVLGVSNVFGVEAWNSYTQNFQRKFELRVTNRFSLALWDGVGNTNRLIRLANGMVGSTIATNFWTNRLSANSFLLPVHTNVFFLPDSAYLSRGSRPLIQVVPGLRIPFENSFDPPRWALIITNRLQYVMIDHSSPSAPPRVVDFVNLDDLVTSVDISGIIAADSMQSASRSVATRQITDRDMWNPTRGSVGGPTAGILNQINTALGDPNVSPDVWRSFVEDPVAGGDKQKSIQEFRDFMRGVSTNLVMQVPFTPTRKIYQRQSWQVNDPLVHYTIEDLNDPVLTAGNGNLMMIRPPNGPLPQSNLGLLNERYRPWGGNPNRSTDETNYRMMVKDPLVRTSDDWDFPTNKIATLGWLGRVHRGTPWQTIYLKAGVEEPGRWLAWSGSLGTHPTNDWKILDLFTVAPNDNAARGLLSVNQSNLAAWSAVLSGVPVLSNSTVNPGPLTGVRFEDVFISPNTPQLHAIVDGINRTRAQQLNGVFQTLGDVLATPELTVASPYLNLTTPQRIERGLTDVAVERIPQQVLSLLKTDEPRLVIYAYGQSLKPAERSLVTSGNFYNICTNYQITGEMATKTVLRIDDAPHRPRIVVENFSILPPE